MLRDTGTVSAVEHPSHAGPRPPQEPGSAQARNQHDAAARRAGIVSLVRERGTLAVSGLPQRFGVSPETIRRDLRRLEETGQVVRAYGSIRAVDSGSFETHQRMRAEHSTQEKLRIAAEAVTRIGQAKTITSTRATCLCSSDAPCPPTAH